MGMQVHFTNPDLQAKIEQWVSQTGRPAEELVEDAMAVISMSWPKFARRSMHAMTT